MSDNKPVDNGRRATLKKMAAAAGVGASIGCPFAALAKSGQSEQSTMPANSKMMMEQCDDSLKKTLPFYGKHQQGIITSEQSEAIFVSFKVVAQTREELIKLMQIITQRCEFLTQGGQQPQGKNPNYPPANSGILGQYVEPDMLSVTVSFGASLFAKGRFGLEKLKPKQLVEMPAFPNDALQKDWCDGDILLQLCANSKESVIYAIRDIIKYSKKYMVPYWKMDGFLPKRDICRKQTAINLFGFKDGTGNASNQDDKLMDELVWVTPNDDEPSWAESGSYQAVRLIRFFVEFWDRTPLGEQEIDFGRHKESGAPLGKQHEMDDPEFDKDPEGKIIPLDSHMRRAEPRTDGQRHVATLRRRSYSFDLGLAKNGQMDMGLIFVCYQANLQTGFIDTQHRLDGEPLEEYIKPYGGGYFFALPGIEKGQYLGEQLLAS